MRTKAEFVNPFVEAGIKVIKELSGVTFRRGHLTFRRNTSPSYDVSIVLGVYGYLSGQVVYSMGQDVAERLVCKMLGDLNESQVEALFGDTLGELANMITGAATAILNDRDDLALMVTTPAIIRGNAMNVSFVTSPTIVLGLYSQWGPIEINIALAPNGNRPVNPVR